MRKKIISIIFVSIIAVAAAWNITQNENETTLSDMVLNNVEALATGESLNPGYRYREPRIDGFGRPIGYNCYGVGIITC